MSKKVKQLKKLMKAFYLTDLFRQIGLSVFEHRQEYGILIKGISKKSPDIVRKIKRNIRTWQK